MNWVFVCLIVCLRDCVMFTEKNKRRIESEPKIIIVIIRRDVYEKKNLSSTTIIKYYNSLRMGDMEQEEEDL